MAIILFDAHRHSAFYPLTLNKSMADLFCGMCTIKQWWHKLSGQSVSVLTKSYLQVLYPAVLYEEVNIYINTVLLGKEHVWQVIEAMELESALLSNDQELLVYKTKKIIDNIDFFISFSLGKVDMFKAHLLKTPADLFLLNAEIMAMQFPYFTKNKQSAAISTTNWVIGKEQIFVEEGCSIEACTLNAQQGPIYIAKGATIMEGTLIRGGLFLGHNSVLKMGTQCYGDTSIASFCTIGGEIKNSIIHSYSNKGHAGYLGDSVIGSWCNLGAGTSASNVLNTAGNVRLFNYLTHSYEVVGKKCGVIMGDHSKTAINTSINTGSSIGVACNVLTNNFTEKILPSFSWGENSIYQWEKLLEHINNWMAFRDCKLSDAEKKVLAFLYRQREMFDDNSIRKALL